MCAGEFYEHNPLKVAALCRRDARPRGFESESSANSFQMGAGSNIHNELHVAHHNCHTYWLEMTNFPDSNCEVLMRLADVWQGVLDAYDEDSSKLPVSAATIKGWKKALANFSNKLTEDYDPYPDEEDMFYTMLIYGVTI